jgi:nicotinate dehydrogenase subunit B
MSALPSMLADNPRLDLWVNFATRGQVAISTGRVEIGQGVLTAMAQIAAEELDVAVARIAILSGDTDHTPNEGYTAGSQSMQMGAVALRQACADVRALFLDRGAQLLACAKTELTVRDGNILRDGKPTGHDYWSLARSVILTTEATATAPRKSPAEYAVVGRNIARLDLPAKVFGQPVFIHDMKLDGMTHARGPPAQSRRDADIRRRASDPPRRARADCFRAGWQFFGDYRRQ